MAMKEQAGETSAA